MMVLIMMFHCQPAKGLSYGNKTAKIQNEDMKQLLLIYGL